MPWPPNSLEARHAKLVGCAHPLYPVRGARPACDPGTVVSATVIASAFLPSRLSWRRVDQFAPAPYLPIWNFATLPLRRPCPLTLALNWSKPWLAPTLVPGLRPDQIGYEALPGEISEFGNTILIGINPVSNPCALAVSPIGDRRRFDVPLRVCITNTSCDAESAKGLFELRQPSICSPDWSSSSTCASTAGGVRNVRSRDR